MKKLLYLLLLVLFTVNTTKAQCNAGETEVTLNLYDSYGDGGGSVTIDGTTYTLGSGSSASFVLCMDLTVCTDIAFTATDSYPYENSWDVVDATGAIIASGADFSGKVGNCAPVTGLMTYVPDDNFEQALINLGYDNFLDDSVLTSNINTVEILDLDHENISHFTGIEDFTALRYFKCDANQFTHLDVSHNLALENLMCYNNSLTSLDLSNNIDLVYLSCQDNQLTSLDVSNNTALTELDCGYNQLTSLDVSNNTALINLNLYNNQLISLDVSDNTVLSSLSCSNNQLSSLDVSSNHNLTYLYAWNNSIVSVSLSTSAYYYNVDLSYNQLTFLDLTNTLFADTANSLFLYSNPNLYCVQVNDTINYYDVEDSAIVSYTIPIWSGVFSYIDSWTSFSTHCNFIYGCTDALALNFDSTANTDDGSCTYQMTYVPDDNFEQALINLGYDDVLDDSVLTASIDTVTILDIFNQNWNWTTTIADLTGIEDFTNFFRFK